MRRLLPFAALLLMAAGPDALYEGRAIVTGTERTTRLDGLARALGDVVVKLSGNPALLHDPRVEALGKSAESLVDDYVYLDRMVDIPHHDEQGTRDRPFSFVVHFNPARMDAALARLGEKPYLALRPRLLMRVAIQDRLGQKFPLTADGPEDERHRVAVLAAADKMGLRVVLLPADHLSARTQAGMLEIRGTLVWSDTAFGWVADWRVTRAGKTQTWRASGLSFDAAYRHAMRGALAVMSGHRLVVPEE